MNKGNYPIHILARSLPLLGMKTLGIIDKDGGEMSDTEQIAPPKKGTQPSTTPTPLIWLWCGDMVGESVVVMIPSCLQHLALGVNRRT